MGRLFFQTVTHHFPDFKKRLEELGDPRKRKMPNGYSIGEIIFAAISLFLLRAGSRNKLNSNVDEDFAVSFRNLFGFRIPHFDTVENCLREFTPSDLEKLQVGLVKTLINSKVLKHGRLNTAHGPKYLVAIDATGVHSSKKEMEGSTSKTSKKGRVTYCRIVLEAKLVTSSGFSISLTHEWIKNPSGKDYDKQDCEIAAFKRLAKKIKSLFPRLGMCILVDGLYASDPFMKVCEQNGWDYIAVLKSKKLGSLWDEVYDSYDEAERRQEVNMCYHDPVEGKKEQLIEWAPDLNYKGHTCSVIQVEETVNGEKTDFAYVTNLKVNPSNVVAISMAGRKRWIIEDSFNTQKNRGYALKHKFSHNFQAYKNYYICLQIAHLLDQLLTLSQHFKKLAQQTRATISSLWASLVSYLTHSKEALLWKPSEKRTKFCYH